jgi:hypothetical protein
MIARQWMFIPFLFGGCLFACGPLTIRDTEKQEFVPMERGVLELHREVVIPAQRTRVFFQDGRLSYGINEFYPHCELRVRDISEQTQTVHADRFSIERVFGSVDEIASSDGIQLAGSVGATLVLGGGANGNGNGEMRLMYTYFMALHSDQQPHVTYFVCGGAFEEPALADYPTLQDIRAAVGEYATLILDADIDDLTN